MSTGETLLRELANVLRVGEHRRLKIRSVHADGPQPGNWATVIDFVQQQRTNHWVDCYVAEFENGEIWICPVMAIRDYAREP